MKKEDLRPVQFEYYSQGTLKGYFHRWVISKSEDGSEYALAIIEREDGEILQVNLSDCKIQFLDGHDNLTADMMPVG